MQPEAPRKSRFEERRWFIGGSDARIILMGSEKPHCSDYGARSAVSAEPLDLSDELIVQLGLVTESLNRRWYERRSGHQIRSVQMRRRHRGFSC
jgi:predicted phage-related endonuclease